MKGSESSHLLYQNPPRLASRYPNIQKMPLKDCLSVLLMRTQSHAQLQLCTLLDDHINKVIFENPMMAQVAA